MPKAPHPLLKAIGWQIRLTRTAKRWSQGVLAAFIISAMPAVYVTPPHLRPVTLWQVQLADGRIGFATVAAATDSCAVVSYLDRHPQDACQFPDREMALARAEEVRRLLVARVKSQ